MRLSHLLRAPLSFAALLAVMLTMPAVAQKRTGSTGEPPSTHPPEAPRGYPVLEGAEAEAVLDAMYAYMDAVYRRDGQAAGRRVTRATLGYYARMRDMAVSAPEVQVRAAPLVDRLTILMLRHRVPADRLRMLTGDAVFAHAVENGWVSRNATRQPPRRISSRVYRDGTRAVLPLGDEDAHFIREDGEWRWDMMPLLHAASAQFAPPPGSGMTEDAYVILLLEQVSGRKVSPGIWNPLP